MARVFITGITGFLGSNIARYLLEARHDVVAIYRENSSRDLCLTYIENVTWIIKDDSDEWINSVANGKIDVVIHAAWLGVGHRERNNWDHQFLNINFLQKVLQVTQKSGAKKLIGLGSQAEYGVFNGCIGENHPLNANEAYGHVKIICSEIIKQFCSYNNIDWYWLRLFSFFGKGESDTWLIPSLIKKITISDEIDLTLGAQKYAYLYVDDLGLAINKIINSQGNPGTYNISGASLLALKDLIQRIRDYINPKFKLNFGALPYRPNQSMHIQGDSAKFVEAFGAFEVSNFDKSLLKTIDYFLKKPFTNK
ncbi:NAD(P)-dependent oxidoreductase [Mucilaginibacter sp.]|uniref:NAD-dependent epimerase/dehydratase family protein n=1 Tax=Mucilaginibacter sp. TaxID=1882438 RepID=UPI0025DDB44C|nr:NAD(P)-dependent oxidoreductase [Mucilaginibacter sp.]